MPVALERWTEIGAVRSLLQKGKEARQNGSLSLRFSSKASPERAFWDQHILNAETT